MIGILLVALVGCSGSPVTPESNVPITLPTLPPTESATEEEATNLPNDTAAPNEPSLAGCRAAPFFGQPIDGFPPVTEDDWSRGPDDAPVTIVVYSDFQ